jgi:hypothetical protein
VLGDETLVDLNRHPQDFHRQTRCRYITKYDIGVYMKERLSTRQAAEKLGVTILTLQRHISAKTIAAPPLLTVGTVKVRLWSNRDIERARKVLVSTRPGRKKKA